jgi:hypothetical protein
MLGSSAWNRSGGAAARSEEAGLAVGGMLAAAMILAACSGGHEARCEKLAKHLSALYADDPEFASHRLARAAPESEPFRNAVEMCETKIDDAKLDCALRATTAAAANTCLFPSPANPIAGAPPVGSEPPSAPRPEPRVTVRDVGFLAPASALYDAAGDLYLVSNVNGGPADADDNGFISRLSPIDHKVELRWIDGAKPEIELHAPRGMAISDGVLWIADIDVVRKFDPTSGAPLGSVAVRGARLLDDVAQADGGGVYVTDTEGDAIYRISTAGAVKPSVRSKKLGGPAGIAVSDDTVYVATFGSGTIVTVSPGGAVEQATTIVKGKLDGLVPIGDGRFLVSSWEGRTVFIGKPCEYCMWRDLQLDIQAPADLGWDASRRMLLVPHFDENALTIINVDALSAPDRGGRYGPIER